MILIKKVLKQHHSNIVSYDRNNKFGYMSGNTFNTYRATKSIFWLRICEGFNDHNVGFQLNRQGFIEILRPRAHKNPSMGMGI